MLSCSSRRVLPSLFRVFRVGSFASVCLCCGRCMSAIYNDRHGCDKHCTYTRRQLLSLYAATTPVSAGVQRRIMFSRPPGCLSPAARSCLSLPWPLPLTRAHVIVGNRPHPPTRERRPTSAIQVHVDGHSSSVGARLVFGCHNIRSVANKLDDLLEVRRDMSVDVMFLVETWHDTDSVASQRLRADGFQVVDRPRPRSRADTLATNHGGLAAFASPGIRLSSLDLGIKRASFELLACYRFV